MPIVDYWALFDNNLATRLIADSESIVEVEVYNNIKLSYV